MLELTVIWSRAVQLWWSLTWRTVLAIVLVHVLLTTLSAVAVEAGLPLPAVYYTYVVLLAFTVIGTTICIVKSILSAHYIDFRVVLVAPSRSYAKTTEELVATWTRAVKVWWSLMWRTSLAFVLLGAPLELILVMAGRPVEPGGALVPVIISYGVIMAFAGVAVTIWIVKCVLAIRYSEFRIALASYDQTAETAAGHHVPAGPVFGIVQNRLGRIVSVLVIAVVGIVIATSGRGPTIGLWAAVIIYSAIALAVLLITIWLILRGIKLLIRRKHKSR